MQTIKRALSAGRGDLTAQVIRKGTRIEGRADVLRPVNWFTAGCQGAPQSVRAQTAWREACLRVRVACKGFVRGWRGGGILGIGRLHAVKIRCTCGNPDVIHPEMVCPVGARENRGLISTKLITDTGVAFLVDDWDNSVTDLTTMNFHGCGTGVAAENQTDSALGTESTTALNPDSTRATGTRSQPAANQYRSVGTVTFDAITAVTEHGILSQAATGGGVLWDRSVFSAINVASGDSIQFTYTCSISAGG